MVIRELDLVFFYEFFKRNFWIMLIAGIITAGASFTVNRYFLKKQYASQTSIFIGRIDVDSEKKAEKTGASAEMMLWRELAIGTQLKEDYQKLISSNHVSKGIAAEYQQRFQREIPVYNISAEVEKKPRFLMITVTSGDPTESRNIAECFNTVFVKEAHNLVGIKNTWIVDKPNFQPAPVAPKVLRNTIAGGLLGIIIAGGIIFVLTICDTRIYSPEELRMIIEPVLGVIQLDSELVKRVESGDSSNQIVSLRATGEAHSSIAESFRAVRTNLQYSDSKHDRNGKVFVFTSAMPSAGKTFTSSNVAVSLAEAGKKTLIINCDLHKPALGTSLGISGADGVVSILAGETTFDEAVIRNYQNLPLDVLLSGPIPPNPSRLLLSDEFKNMLASLRETYEYIIIDAPPMLGVTDAAIVGQQADGVIL
ncbi:MAG: polysaccharide biosynthesis tyrosine autokinase, partial [Lentisphaerae bacterium]|nr:polysaccharide biosynthesis tyrosine autokinase [Lentisphaerota bacterium]